jgi:hypothetical protein
MPTHTNQIQGSTDVGPLSDTRAGPASREPYPLDTKAHDPQLRLSTRYDGGLQRLPTSLLMQSCH